MTEQRSVPLSSITEVDGHNPRQRSDEEADRQLADSIARHGVIQPLVVTSDGNGCYRLVAGHRRFAAAAAAAVTEVPVVVRPPGEEKSLELTVVENLLREDLDPVSEALGIQRLMKSEKLNQGEAAERLSISPARVSERLRLLKLPEPVQEHVGSGVLPTSAAKVLLEIAKVSPAVATAAAELVAAEAFTPQELEESPATVLERVCSLEDGPPLVAAGGYHAAYDLEELPLSEEVAEELGARLERATADAYYSPTGFVFDRDDVDAARAYGCLIEIKEERYFARSFITDPEFIADRIRENVEGLEEQARKRAELDAERAAERATQGEEPGQGEEDDPAQGTPEDPEEARRREREAEKESRTEAHAANVRLGANLAEGLHEVPLTRELARLLGLIVLDEHAIGLAARGLRYVREDWQEVETRELKSGERREKVLYLEPTQAEERLYEWFEAARTPEQMLGRIVQALVAAHCADDAAVAMSNRSHYELPGVYGGGPPRAIPELVEDLAAAHLPVRLAEQLRERRERRKRWAVDDEDLASEDLEAVDPDESAAA